MTDATVRVAVLGGGVSGLVAALRLRTAFGDDAVVEVFEESSTPGGLLASRDLVGRSLDSGAESFIVRRPEAVALVAELGLTDRVVSPTGLRPAVLAGGRLHDLPRPTLMGVPGDVAAVADVIEPTDAERMRSETTRPLQWTPGSDRSVGELVADRFGRSVVDRSVDPMLSGVYSCRSDDIGVRAALPQLAARLDAGAPGLGAAVSGLLPPPSTAPVFGALDGGYRLLVEALVARSGATVRLGRRATGLYRDGDRWIVETDPGGRSAHDAVVVALPAPAAAELLAVDVPDVAGPLSHIATASSALVLLAVDPSVTLPEHSGVLVATGEALTAKAITLSSRKWAHLRSDSGPGLVRASFGRYGDTVDSLDDATLIAAAVDDLSTAIGLADRGRGMAGDDVVDASVQRWPVGLPRYAPGHRDTVAAVARARPRGLALCGSAYDGVGVPACIARAGVAVAEVVTDLAVRRDRAGGTMGA